MKNTMNAACAALAFVGVSQPVFADETTDLALQHAMLRHACDNPGVLLEKKVEDQASYYISIDGRESFKVFATILSGDVPSGNYEAEIVMDQSVQPFICTYA